MAPSALDALVSTVRVAPIGDDRFEGPGSSDDGVDATFGGHFLGQATAAALATVDRAPARALVARLLPPGRPSRPALHAPRSSGSATGAVSAPGGSRSPRGAAPRCSSCCSRPPSPRTVRRATPDPVAGFKRASRTERRSQTQRELMATLDPAPATGGVGTARLRARHPHDQRTVGAPPVRRPTEGIRLWVRARAPVPVDDHHLQAALLAYQSDESLADNIAIAWGATWGSPGVVFREPGPRHVVPPPVRSERSGSSSTSSPVTVGRGRGLATGNVYDRGGQLVVSFTPGSAAPPDPGAPRFTGQRRPTTCRPTTCRPTTCRPERGLDVRYSAAETGFGTDLRGAAVLRGERPTVDVPAHRPCVGRLRNPRNPSARRRSRRQRRRRSFRRGDRRRTLNLDPEDRPGVVVVVVHRIVQDRPVVPDDEIAGPPVVPRLEVRAGRCARTGTRAVLGSRSPATRRTGW